MELLHVDSLSKPYLWSDAVGLVTKSLGEAGGSERLYVNIDTVPPGAYSTKYHSHSRQEEFFLILEGTGAESQVSATEKLPPNISHGECQSRHFLGLELMMAMT